MTFSTALALKFQGHRLRFIEPMKQFRVGNFYVVAFETQHDCAGSVGFIITDGEDRLLFATDTFYLKNRFANLNIVAIECNYSEETMTPGLHPVRLKRLYTSHFSLKNVKSFISANDMSQVREIHLIHMSQANADPGYFQDEIERLTGKPTITHM